MQILEATAFDDLLTSIDLIVAVVWHLGECIGLLCVTSEDITMDSPRENPNPNVGGDGPRAAAVVATAELL